MRMLPTFSDLFLILAIWGAIVDSRYKRRGGTSEKESRTEHLSFRVQAMRNRCLSNLGHDAVSHSHTSKPLRQRVLIIDKLK